jgi:hypothetical protein
MNGRKEVVGKKTCHNFLNTKRITDLSRKMHQHTCPSRAVQQLVSRHHSRRETHTHTHTQTHTPLFVFFCVFLPDQLMKLLLHLGNCFHWVEIFQGSWRGFHTKPITSYTFYYTVGCKQISSYINWHPQNPRILRKKRFTAQRAPVQGCCPERVKASSNQRESPPRVQQ